MAQKNVNYQEVQTAKAFVSTGGIQFGTPQNYADKFLEATGMQPDKCRFELQGETQNANEDGSLNTSFSRILTETKLNFEDSLMEHTVGAVIQLDSQKPLIRVYSGARVFACSNLCISGADEVFSAEILTNLDSAYNVLKQYVQEAEANWRKSLLIWKTLQETTWSGSEVQDKLGFMLKEVIQNPKFIKLGTTPVVGAAKLLFQKSDYQIKDNTTTAWNTYQALTQSIGNQNDIISAPVKTLIATKLITNN